MPLFEQIFFLFSDFDCMCTAYDCLQMHVKPFLFRVTSLMGGPRRQTERGMDSLPLGIINGRVAELQVAEHVHTLEATLPLTECPLYILLGAHELWAQRTPV